MKSIEYEDFELKLFHPYEPPPPKSKRKRESAQKGVGRRRSVAATSSQSHPQKAVKPPAAQSIYSIRVTRTPLPAMGLGRMTRLDLTGVIQFVQANLPTGYAPSTVPLSETLASQAASDFSSSSASSVAFEAEPTDQTFIFNRHELDPIMQTAGQLLYQALPEPIPTALKEAYQYCRQRGKGLRLNINLTLTPLLYVLPWELLFYQEQNDYFALSKLTPIRRVVETPVRLEDEAELTGEDLQRVLVVLIASQPGDDLLMKQTQATFEQLAIALQAKGRSIRLDRLNGYVSFERLQRHLARHDDYDLIHFVGHGVWDGVNQNTALLFHPPMALRARAHERQSARPGETFDTTSHTSAEDQPQDQSHPDFDYNFDRDFDVDEVIKLGTVEVGAADLRRLLADLTDLKLVFLNSCQSGRVDASPDLSLSNSNSIENKDSPPSDEPVGWEEAEAEVEDETRAFDNLGPGLSKNGLPAIISMQYEVGRVAASLFAQTFYGCLGAGAGVSLSQAVAEGRKALARQGLHRAALYNQWFVPVYYGAINAPASTETLLNRGLDYLYRRLLTVGRPGDYGGVVIALIVTGLGVGWLGPAIRGLAEASNLVTVGWFILLSYFYKALIAAWFYRDLRLNPLFRFKDWRPKFYLALSTYIGAALGFLTGLVVVYFIYGWLILVGLNWPASGPEFDWVLNGVIVIPLTTLAALYARRIAFTNRFTTVIFKPSGQELFILVALAFLVVEAGIAILLLMQPGLLFSPGGATLAFLVLFFSILVGLQQLGRNEALSE